MCDAKLLESHEQSENKTKQPNAEINQPSEKEQIQALKEKVSGLEEQLLETLSLMKEVTITLLLWKKKFGEF